MQTSNNDNKTQDDDGDGDDDGDDDDDDDDDDGDGDHDDGDGRGDGCDDGDEKDEDEAEANNDDSTKETAKDDNANTSTPIVLSVLGFPDYANAPADSLVNPADQEGKPPQPLLVRPQKAKKSARRTPFPAQFFPSLMHAILTRAEADGYAHICAWKPHGRSFVVWDRDLFVQQVMPMYFRQSQFASFQRQLNLYGFQRLSRKYTDCFGVYYHPLFLRSRHDLCPAIPRVEKADTTKPSLPTLTDDDFMKLPTMPPCTKEHLDMAKRLAFPYHHKRQLELQQEQELNQEHKQGGEQESTQQLSAVPSRTRKARSAGLLRAKKESRTSDYFAQFLFTLQQQPTTINTKEEESAIQEQPQFGLEPESSSFYATNTNTSTDIMSKKSINTGTMQSNSLWSPMLPTIEMEGPVPPLLELPSVTVGTTATSRTSRGTHRSAKNADHHHPLCSDENVVSILDTTTTTTDDKKNKNPEQERTLPDKNVLYATPFLPTAPTLLFDSMRTNEGDTKLFADPETSTATAAPSTTTTTSSLVGFASHEPIQPTASYLLADRTAHRATTTHQQAEEYHHDYDGDAHDDREVLPFLGDNYWMEPRPIDPSVEAMLQASQKQTSMVVNKNPPLSSDVMLERDPELQELAPELLALLQEPEEEVPKTTPITPRIFDQHDEHEHEQEQQQGEEQQQQRPEHLDLKPPAKPT
ncbi:hypothetical protein ACA910_013699 [Epithemia clementina (nom. ined.)]